MSDAQIDLARPARGIDHLVLAGENLASLAELYRRLGFQVGARNRHDWGTENHIVQLDGAFLELIGRCEGFVPPAPDAATAPFAGFIDAYLRHRQGLAMLVLRSHDALADHAAFATKGVAIGAPFHFERRGKRPDGSDVQVAFSLAFARSPVIADAGFFVCQHHFPQNFWNPAFQVHANTARRILGVVMVAEAPAVLAGFLSDFAGGASASASPSGIEIVTGSGSIEVLIPEAFRRRYGEHSLASETGPRFVAYRIAVADVEAAAAVLAANDVPHARIGCAMLTSAAGCTLSFEPLD